MRRRLAWNTVVVLLSLAAVSVLAATIVLGGLDRLAADGAVARRPAIGSLMTYWFLFVTVVWLIPFAVRHPKEIGLCLVSVAGTLGLVEIGLRAFVPGTRAVNLDTGGFRSREFHHIYPAHARRFMGRYDGTDVFVDTNEDGLRTSYSKAEFVKRDHRVIFLGDSFTFGFGVTAEGAFPSLVEARLQQALSPETVAVLNAGIISYSPFLERLLFEKKLIEYRPTLVVLFLDATDIGDDYKYMRTAERSGGTWVFPFDDGTPVAYRGALREWTRPYQRHLASALSYPLELAGFRTGPRSSDEYYDFEITIANFREKNRYFIYRHPLDHTRWLFDDTLRNVDEIAARSRQVGAGFALVVTPRFHHWNVKECPNNWEKREYRRTEPYQFEYFRYFDESARDYPIINLLPDFKATDQYPLVFHFDPHWNAAGHAFVADTMTGHLLTRGMIRPTSTEGRE